MTTMIGTEGFAFQVIGLQAQDRSHVALRGLNSGAVGVGY